MSKIEKKWSIGSARESLFLLPILKDNYAYVISWDENALVIDPGEARPILSLLKKERLTLKHILVTHHHSDHIGGCDLLKQETGCALIGPNDERIPGIDKIVSDQEQLTLGPFLIKVLATAGHTRSHLAYYFAQQNLLFSGDLLFGGGCGRLFEGTPQQMWQSLQKVIDLPDQTRIYFGHEYTERNLLFAAELEPKNQQVALRLKKVKIACQKKEPTSPSTLAKERATNPFLRVQEEKLQQAVGMEGADPIAVFASIRSRKDKF